jgi:hypothetical protein
VLNDKKPEDSMATFAKENLFLVLWLFSKEISYRW